MQLLISWVGYVERMNEDRIPNVLMYNQFDSEQKNVDCRGSDIKTI